jgi:hypothetical protein
MAAALAAAGAPTSMAQGVFSVNAVGYVNVPLTPGFNLVANPLQATDNTIANLFKNISPSIPPGLKVFAFDDVTGGFAPAATYRGAPFNRFDPPASAALTIDVGEGAFVFDPRVTGSAALTLTFVGEVRQGTLDNPLPAGFSIKANMVPQSGRPSDFGTLPAAPGDKLFKFNKTTGGYDTWTYRGAPFNRWQGADGSTTLPVIDVGEAFFYYRAGAAATWSRTFNVNQG